MTTSDTAKHRFRWWPAAAILILAAIAEAVLWTRNAGDALAQVLSTWTVGLTTFALMLIWWLAFSRVAWKTRLAGLGALALAVALFFALFRLEGFGGDFSPRFAWRFSDSAEQGAAQSIAERATHRDAGVAGERLELAPDDWPGFRGPNRDGKALGEVVRIVPNHVCVVVNMVDRLVTVRGDKLVGELPVAARGKLG